MVISKFKWKTKKTKEQGRKVTDRSDLEARGRPSPRSCVTKTTTITLYNIQHICSRRKISKGTKELRLGESYYYWITYIEKHLLTAEANEFEFTR